MKTLCRSTRLRHGLGLACSVAVWLGLATFATRASAEVVSLHDLETNAVHRRATVAAVSERSAAAKAGVRVARSAYAPAAALNIEASGSPGGRLIQVADTSGGEYLVSGSRRVGESGAFIPQARYGALLSMGGRLYDFGRTRASVRAAEAEGAAASAYEGATRMTVVQEVRTAYLGWLEAVAIHATSERAVANAHARRQLVQARIETGVRPGSDVGPVLYDEALAMLDESAARGHLSEARLEVERASATVLARDAVPDTSLLEREEPFGGASGSPGRIAIEKRGAAARATVRMREHESSPVLSVGAEAGVRGQTFDVFPAYRAFLSLSVPLWDGGATDARAAAARADAAALEAEAREERATLATTQKRARVDLDNAGERVRLAEYLLVIAGTRARDAEARYDIGNEKVEIVLEANVALLRAQRELLLAKVARAGAALQLQAAQ